MDVPTMLKPRTVAADTTSLPSYLPLPGHGLVPANAFVIKSAEPVLVDTGLAALRDGFMDALRSVLDPGDLKWIWLTHMDADHIGNLEAVLAEAPNARIVTNFLGMGKMMLQGLPLDRVHMLDPGTSLDVGDRSLAPLRPPYYDAPETTGLFDTKMRALFCADSFGALLQEPADDAAAVAPDALREGMTAWAAVDCPWLAMVDEDRFGRVLAGLQRLDPSVILSSHLPAASGVTAMLMDCLSHARRVGQADMSAHESIEQLAAANVAPSVPANVA